MPWTAKDAKKFKKDITPTQQHQWAAIANRVLAQGGKEGDAIKKANAVTKGAVERKLNKKSKVRNTTFGKY